MSARTSQPVCSRTASRSSIVEHRHGIIVLRSTGQHGLGRSRILTRWIVALGLLLAVGYAPAPAGAEDAAALYRGAAQAYDSGHYADAVRLAKRALDLRQQTLGPDHSETIRSALQLSRACRRNGDYAKALALAQRAVDLREKTAGADSPDTAEALVALAEVYRARSEYASGVPLAQRALAIREGTPHGDACDTARALHCLAELYGGMGDYPKALPLAQRSLDIREKSCGVESRDTAESLNDIGLLYFNLHDDGQAEARYERALAIRQKLLGPDHPLTAETVNNLAALYWREKHFDRALRLFTRALQSKEKMLGPEHPQTAVALNNLAEVYRSMGDIGRALPLAKRAAAIWEKVLGPSDPHTAAALNNVAGFYWSAGDYRHAEPLLRRASAIWEHGLGPENPDTARSWNLLAAFYSSTGDYAHALAYYRRGLAAEDQVLASVFAVTSEEQKLEYIEKTQGHYLAALSLIQQHFIHDPTAVRFGLELVLRRKGIVLDAQARTRDAIARHLQGATRRAWERLGKSRRELAKLLLDGPGDASPDAYRRSIQELEDDIAAEERYLSLHSGVVAADLAQRQVTADLVARRLPAGSALVEFVRIRDWDERRLVWLPSSRYLAFVLTADNRVRLADLGDAADMDTEVQGALQAVNDPHFLKDLAAYTRNTDAALGQLYSRLLQPLEPAIDGTGILIVSPDGELNKVPFAALRLPTGRYLIERRAVSYVASGRDLLRGKSGVPPTLNMLLVANPAFDDRSALRASAFRSRPVVRAPDYQPVEYPPLPGTAAEAKLIPPLVRGSKRILVGKEATESAVRSTRSPRILHIATHGFFLPDAPADQFAPDPLGRGQRPVFRGGAEGPLARSGLALAGANHADEVTAGDDGILTALEVTSMDLYGTDLAVLSACETALGQIRDGEGVFGLRRAFVLAGARNLMISLWPVSDRITRDLMVRFYRSYEQGTPVAAALRDAEVQTIASLRTITSAGAEHRAYAPVVLWAPFIVQQAGVN
jgi:CHAT domain-containing protein